VCVGDLVNKGPKSVEAVRLVKNHPNMFALRGNHEENLIRAFFNRQNDPDAEPKYKYVDDFTLEEIEWLCSLPFTIKLPHLNVMCVHAGVVPGIHLNEQDPENMVTMRNLVKDSQASNSASKWTAHSSPESGVAWASEYNGPEHVIYGHDAKRGFIQFPYATGLDSGCCYGGELTAVILPARQFVQIESRLPKKDRKEKHKRKPDGIKSRLVEGNAGMMKGVCDVESLGIEAGQAALFVSQKETYQTSSQ